MVGVFKRFDLKGEKLESFLKKNESYIRKKRGFYVLTFNLDKKDVVKIGIASRDVKLRLDSYKTNFGSHNPNYPCRGVFIHYLIISETNKKVSDTQTAVYKLEREMIKDLKAKSIKVERGKEWFFTGLRNMYKLLNTKKFEEMEYHHSHNLRSGSGRKGMALEKKNKGKTIGGYSKVR